MRSLLLLGALLLPLGVDSLALGAALGIAGLPRQDRLRISLVLAAFEGGMPIVGFLAGAGLGHILGAVAGYTGIAALAVAGVLLLRDDDDGNEARMRLLGRARGLAVVDLGIGVSVDELALGVGAGLLGLSIPVVVVWLTIQAFLAVQVGLRIGARAGEALRERAETTAGAALLLTALLLLALRVMSR